MPHKFVKEIEEIELKTFHFEDDGQIPNNPDLPLILYSAVLDLASNDLATVSETIFRANGWTGTWRNGIFSYHHFHSTAHEVLAIAGGQANVHLGGERGIVVTVQAGDVVVIPAGVGHKNLGSSRDLLVIGAYPAGQSWDLCRGYSDERPQVLHNISNVPLPEQDPVYGAVGPLLDCWS
ncbi:MAG: cupin domain-containing protein [Chloroflexota bacterium]